jgi:molecular chaperone DnaK (HSP70)
MKFLSTCSHILLVLPWVLLQQVADASIFGRRQSHSFAAGRSVAELRGGGDDKIKGPCIGIDLGTTYSCVAVWRNNRVDICPNEQGHRITPSYVAFLKDGTRLVGDAAKNQASQNPSGTIFDVKRLIGRNYNDATVQRDKKLFPFGISDDKHGKPVLELDKSLASKHAKTQFTPEEVSGMILRKMKEIAETYLGQEGRYDEYVDG